MIEEHKLDLPLLHDAGNAYTAQLGIRFTLPEDLRDVYLQFDIDVPAHNGEPSWTLPMPARYVIDTGGVIRSAAVHADYTRRPEPADTLVAVKNL